MLGEGGSFPCASHPPSPLDANGDPLQDFTLLRFLDRFVYKNHKQKISGSLMQRPSQGGYK